MKLVVMSDSHGNIANIKHVLGFAKKINAGAIVHCGDWNNVAAINAVFESKLLVYGVLGNADIDPETTNKFSEQLLEIEIDGQKIGVVHNIDQIRNLEAKPFDILFVGHKHKQEQTTINKIKVVNPGALENNISFAIYDTKSSKVEFIKI